MMNRLYRSETDKILGGVCGGLGAYLGFDPVIIRIFFVLLTIANGVGVMIYMLLWLILPAESKAENGSTHQNLENAADEITTRAKEMAGELQAAVTRPNRQGALYIGAALILLGVIFLVENLNIGWLWWLDFDFLWPVLLIGGGIILFVRYMREK
jgi:phage shock protein PspC (stress-responsive transcriptional regulator)